MHPGVTILARAKARLQRHGQHVGKFDPQLANDEQVMLGVRNHAREELAGVQLQDGQTFTVFTLREGRIVRLRGYIHREEALAEAGLSGYRWR